MDWRIKRHLYYHINSAIEGSISGLRYHHEPDYIAALVTKLPLQLQRVLNTALPHIKFKVGGCFIHQKPLAKFCDSKLSSKKSEMGDLLIVYKEIRGSETLYNSLLLQAKKSNNIYHTTIPTDDKHQLMLYTIWPKFEYANAGESLKGKTRSITPKTITTGAQYLLIDESKCGNPCCPTTFWCAMPDINLVASCSLTLQIIRLIEFQTGKPFVSKSSSNKDDWSQMIWDLLNISASASSCFNRRKAGYHKTDRYAGDPINMFLDSAKDGISSDGDGISVLCIEGNTGIDNNHN